MEYQSDTEKALRYIIKRIDLEEADISTIPDDKKDYWHGFNFGLERAKNQIRDTYPHLFFTK